MIIVLSGWRGLPRTAARKEREASQAVIREACFEVLSAYLTRFPFAHYRVGDAPGVDEEYRRQFSSPQPRRMLHRAGGTWKEYVADWGLPNDSGGPVRNNAMLDGDGTLHEQTGIAHLVVAMPEAGKRKKNSGTWGCVEAAHERYIPVQIVHLVARPEYAAAGVRRTRLPQFATELTQPLVVAR